MSNSADTKFLRLLKDHGGYISANSAIKLIVKYPLHENGIQWSIKKSQIKRGDAYFNGIPFACIIITGLRASSFGSINLHEIIKFVQYDGINYKVAGGRLINKMESHGYLCEEFDIYCVDVDSPCQGLQDGRYNN